MLEGSAAAQVSGIGAAGEGSLSSCVPDVLHDSAPVSSATFALSRECGQPFIGGSGTFVNDIHLGGFNLESAADEAEREAGPAGVHGRALTNLELLGKWRVLPFHLLLAQRRFGWLQCMVQHPQHNEQVVAALFGRMEVSGDNWKASLSTLGPDGRLSDEYSSSLTQAFVYAIEVFRGISGTEAVFDHWARYDDSLKALFLSKPLGKDFCLVDSALLQAAFFADHSWGAERQIAQCCRTW